MMGAVVHSKASSSGSAAAAAAAVGCERMVAALVQQRCGMHRVCCEMPAGRSAAADVQQHCEGI
jgi:hypothetical protein